MKIGEENEEERGCSDEISQKPQVVEFRNPEVRTTFVLKICCIPKSNLPKSSVQIFKRLASKFRRC